METASIGYMIALKEKACSAKLLQLLESYITIYIQLVKETSFIQNVLGNSSYKTIDTFIQEQQSFINGCTGSDMKRELALTTSFKKTFVHTAWPIL